MSFETISLISMPSAAGFARLKKKVIGVDVNQKTVDTINRGEIHIVAPDLDMVLHAAVKQRNTGYAFQAERGLQEIMKADNRRPLVTVSLNRI